MTNRRDNTSFFLFFCKWHFFFSNFALSLFSNFCLLPPPAVKTAIVVRRTTSEQVSLFRHSWRPDSHLYLGICEQERLFYWLSVLIFPRRFLFAEKRPFTNLGEEEEGIYFWKTNKNMIITILQQQFVIFIQEKYNVLKKSLALRAPLPHRYPSGPI